MKKALLSILVAFAVIFISGANLSSEASGEIRKPIEKPAAAPQTDVPQPEQPFYTVAKGDTIYSISAKFGIDWKDVSAKAKTRHTIRVGEKIYLSDLTSGSVASVKSDATSVQKPADPIKNTGNVKSQADNFTEFMWNNVGVQPYKKYADGSPERHAHDLKGLVKVGVSEAVAKIILTMHESNQNHEIREIKKGDRFDAMLSANAIVRRNVVVNFVSTPAIVYDLGGIEVWYAICGNWAIKKKPVVELPPPPQPPPPPPGLPEGIYADLQSAYLKAKAYVEVSLSGSREWFNGGTWDRAAGISATLYTFFQNEDYSGWNGGVNWTYSVFDGAVGHNNDPRFLGEIRTYGPAGKYRGEGRDYFASVGLMLREDRNWSQNEWGRYDSYQESQGIGGFASIEDYHRQDMRWLPRWRLGMGFGFALDEERRSTWTDARTGIVSRLNDAPDNKDFIFGIAYTDFLTIGSTAYKDIQLFAEARPRYDFGPRDLSLRLTAGVNLFNDSIRIGPGVTLVDGGGRGHGIYGEANLHNLYHYVRQLPSRFSDNNNDRAGKNGSNHKLPVKEVPASKPLVSDDSPRLAPEGSANQGQDQRVDNQSQWTVKLIKDDPGSKVEESRPSGLTTYDVQSCK